MSDARFERAVILIISAVQFVNVLEFMMVLPLGPDFAVSLGIPTSSLGYIGGAYTAAAAVSGLASSLLLERFDRRSALAFSMAGLFLATVLGGLATSFATLIAARVLAGVFGGPAMAVALAIVADVIPPERRGKAMGVVMGSFAIASVFGVPAGLELARLGSWRTPFFAVAALALVIMLVAVRRLPRMTGHIESRTAGASTAAIVAMMRRPEVIQATAMTSLLMMGAFMLIPHLATYVQYNLGYPREQLGLLYMVGGLCSFVVMRVTGPLVDRYGSFRVGSFGTLLLVVVLYWSFIEPRHLIPAMGIYAAFMVTTGIRNISFQTLSTKVPRPNERASYMSIQSSVQHVATSIGAVVSSQLLTEAPDLSLVGVEQVTWLAIVTSATLPLFLYVVERRVRVRQVATA